MNWWFIITLILHNFSLTNQISLKDLSNNSGQWWTFTDLDISEIERDDDAEFDTFCKDSVCVYGSRYETIGDAEDVFYVRKSRCKVLYVCREYFHAGGDEKHIKYVHTHTRGKTWWNDIIKCNSMQSDMKQMDIKALSCFQIMNNYQCIPFIFLCIEYILFVFHLFYDLFISKSSKRANE